MFGSLIVIRRIYTASTVPGAGAWKLMVNKKTGQWGIPYTKKRRIRSSDAPI